jgi:ribonuclease D
VVVHAGREEIRLCHLGGGQPPGNIFDLQLAAGLVGLTYPIGHGPLIQQLLGIRVAKGETLTDWRRRPLSPQQIAYAFDDVRHLLPLAGKLTTRLDRLGRAAWMREETDELIRRAVLENPAAEKWRKLRGIGSLDRKRLAIARALYVWREEQAARHNRPIRVILRDDLIAEIARRNPTKERDLSLVRGLGHRDLESILRVVQEARALPPDQWPEAVERDFDPPQVALVGGLLQAVLGDLCARRELAASLVTTASELRGLVRTRMQKADPAEGPLTKGWRAAEVLPELLAVLDGRRAVGVRDLNAEAPLFQSEVR